jgi:hypothetical protein
MFSNVGLIALAAVIIPLLLVSLVTAHGQTILKVLTVDSLGTHEIELKATEVKKVSGFGIDAEDVVQVREGDNLVVFTDPANLVNNVKVQNIQGQFTKFVPLQNNAWSLQGLSRGVYMLDVIVDMPGTEGSGVYETLLA